MEDSSEGFEFRATEATSLDAQLIRALNAMAYAGNVDQIIEALTQSADQEQETDSPLVKALRSARTSPKFCYFEVVIQRALDNGESLEDILQAIDHHLMALFPNTNPVISDDVEILTFLMHYAVHGPVWRVTGGVTLLDAYLDLTVADLQLFNAETHGGYFASSIPGTVTAYCTITEQEFHAEKWRLLDAVLRLDGDSVCNAPGVKIVDDILSSLDGQAHLIQGTKNNFQNYFEDHINEPPAAIIQLISIISNTPIHLGDFDGVLNGLNIVDENDPLVIETLRRLHDLILTKYRNAVDSFRAHITTELGNVDDNYINDCIAACEAYLFTDAVMEVLTLFYPHYGIDGIAHWFMNSPGYDWFLGTLDNPIETEVKKGKKTRTQIDYITAQRIINGGDACYDMVYLLTKIGKPKRRIGSLNGLAKGIVRAEDRPQAPQEKLRSTAGFRAPRAKKPVEVATNEASCVLDLLMRTYRFQALNHLMYREVHFLDPIIGDTLCELRPAFLMDCDIIIQAALPNHQNWQDLVRAYNTSRRNCLLDERVITGPLDIIGVESEPYDYVILCRALEGALQGPAGEPYFPRFLTLCKAMTRSTMLVRDPLGTEMGEYDTGIMERYQRQPRRMELGTYNIWYTKSRVTALCNENVNGHPLTKNCQLLETTANVLNTCHVLHKDGEIPVVPLYQAQLFTMLKAYVLNRPIIVRLKRIHITSRREDLTFNVGKGSTETLDNFNYQIVGSEVLVFEPNHQTGGFDFLANPDDELLDLPCMTISAYGLLDLTDPDSWYTDPGCQSGRVGNGYYAQNATAYIEFVETQNVVNLLNVCSANHPPFAPDPRVINPAQQDRETALLGQYNNINSCADERQFWLDLKRMRDDNHVMGDQFAYLAGLYGYRANDLVGDSEIVFGGAYTLYQDGAFKDFVEFYWLGEETELGTRQFKERTLTTYDDDGQHTVYKRRRGNMPFYSTHIYCSTLRVERLRNRDDGNGFYRTDPVDSFEDKDVVVDFTMAYLLQELNDAQSTRPDQDD